MSSRLPLMLASLALMFALNLAASARAELEIHYTFDDMNQVTADSSGKNRHGFLDDFDVTWIDDEQRGGGVLEFGGTEGGFIVSEIPDLSEGFTIMMWVYRDPDLCCQEPGANAGLFHVQLSTDDPENLPFPSNATSSKAIGGWVQKSDGAVWGRVTTTAGNQNLPNNAYFLEDEVWTHLAYRGTGEDLEVLVNGESGVGLFVPYDGTDLIDHDIIYIGRQANETWGGRLDDVRVYSHALTDEEIAEIVGGGGGGGLLGDFNQDGLLDAADIDALTGVVIAGTHDAAYDLDNDGQVLEEDRRVWIEDLKNTYYGDANLDGQFNSGDLVGVLSAGVYENNVDAGWTAGDFNGDRRTNSSDLVAALAGGGYEQGPRPAVSAVPEPGSLLLVILALPLVALRRRTPITGRER